MPAATWRQEDLVARLGRVLKVAAHAVEVLVPHGYASVDGSDEGVSGHKVLAETALLLLAAQPAATLFPSLAQRVREIGEALIPHARSERVYAAICMEPAVALDYGFAHLCLARLGWPDPAMDVLLSRALEAPSPAGPERLPHRQLEQAFVRRLIPGGSPDGRHGGAARSSMLGRPLNALTASRDEVYALTHALMYVTDLGSRRVRLPSPVRSILDGAAAAVAGCLDDEDYDLGGEVLLAWPYLGSPWSPAATFALTVLTHVEDKAGFLPGPLTQVARLNRLHGADREQYLLASAYHTVYVMGLLCAAALRPGGTPPAFPSGPGSAAGVDALADLVSGSEPEPHWRGVFDGLPPAQRASLGSFLLAICLRRAARAHDFAAAERALNVAARHDLNGGLASAQAAHLLTRVALLAGTLDHPASRSA